MLVVHDFFRGLSFCLILGIGRAWRGVSGRVVNAWGPRGFVRGVLYGVQSWKEDLDGLGCRDLQKPVYELGKCRFKFMNIHSSTP